MKYFHILTYIYIYTLDLPRGNGNLLNFYVRTYIHICTYIYFSGTICVFYTFDRVGEENCRAQAIREEKFISDSFI